MARDPASERTLHEPWDDENIGVKPPAGSSPVDEGRGGRRTRATRRTPESESQLSKPNLSSRARNVAHKVGRERVKAAADELSEDVVNFFREALQAEKEVSVFCASCRKYVKGPASDWAARDRVVNTMFTQGYGRPVQEEAEGGRGFVLKRVLVAPEGAEVVTHDETGGEAGSSLGEAG